MKYVMLRKIAVAAVMVFLLAGIAYGDNGVMTLPAEISVIETEAFLGLTGIERVELPDTVTAIGSRAFADSSIESITLPNDLKDIAGDAFDGCDELTVWVYPGSYGVEYCIDNSVRYELIPTAADQFEYTAYDAENVRITRYVGSDAIVVIPDTIDGCAVSEIGNGAFSGCMGITEVVVPEGVEKIGDICFS